MKLNNNPFDANGAPPSEAFTSIVEALIDIGLNVPVNVLAIDDTGGMAHIMYDRDGSGKLTIAVKLGEVAMSPAAKKDGH